MGHASVRIEFLKKETRRYESVLHRPDGIDVALEGGSYNKLGSRHGAEVPHDLVRHARVIAGRQAPHATERGRAVVVEAGDRIMQAEMLTRAVCDVCSDKVPAEPQTIKRTLGARWWSDTVTQAALDRACARLRTAADSWAQLVPGAALEETWSR